MHLSKPDIFQAAIVALALVASAVAVPLIASRPNSQLVATPTVQNTQQLAQRQCLEMVSAHQALSNAHERLKRVANDNQGHQQYALQDTEHALGQVQEALNVGECQD
jgi:hypothetical protein